MPIPPECRRCERPIASRHARGHRPPGTLYHGQRGLCTSCVQHFRRNDPDGLLDYQRLTHSWAEVAEEWDTLDKRGMTRAQATDTLAARLGMTAKAVDKTLERLRVRKTWDVAA